MTADSDRYEGKPLLRLVELWVLWLIDELPEKDAKMLEEMEPKLQESWGQSGSWHECLENVLNLSPKIREETRELWERNCRTAELTGLARPTTKFAQAIADQIASYSRVPE